MAFLHAGAVRAKMMVDERIFPHPDAVMKWIFWPWIFWTMRLHSEELPLD
jgi:hypothetical protein